MMKKALSSLLALVLVLTSLSPLAVLGVGFDEDIECKSAILVEQSTGRVLYEKNADEPLPPASVTKIMTLLLTFEALECGRIHLDDTVVASEYAASMGGSQVFLKAGEQMSVSDMIKSVCVASANDCAVALAEHIYSSESAFVQKMNERAAELGMSGTVFKNATGLDDTDTGHLTCARDISIMSRELMKHKAIFDYTTIWTDTIRNGQFGLTNTNKLIRFYRGANGLKTGSTSKAKFCISATALRDGMQLIAVVMASDTAKTRNAIAQKLLDHGFSNYGIYSADASSLPPLAVRGSAVGEVGISHSSSSCLLEKARIKDVTYEIELPDYVTAPLKKGERVGQIVFYCNGEKINAVDIVADCEVKRITFWQSFLILLERFLMSPSCSSDVEP